MIRFLLPLLALTSCATTTASTVSAPASPPTDGIVYETGPCFGTCPVYRVAVTQHLPINFDGRRFTAVVGERIVPLPAEGSLDAYYKVLELLRPYRPNGAVIYAPGQANCPNAPTDMPSVTVEWISTSAQKFDRLSFYYGCAAANPELAAALRKVPDLLPIADLIGKR